MLRPWLGIACALIASPGVANDSAPFRFAAKYGDWAPLAPSSKAAYAAGAFDSLTLSGDSQDSNADLRGIAICARADGLTPAILAQMVDARYVAHAEEWSFGPASVLAGALLDACKAQVNTERRKAGLSDHP